MLEDISGNSFVQNPDAPKVDENCKTIYFSRSLEQDHELGIFSHEEIEGDKEGDSAILHPISEGQFKLEDLEGEVLQFPTNCHGCGSPCETNMKMTSILFLNN